MVQLEMVAYNLRSQMNQAEWQSFIGGFATGFGVVNGDGSLALSGGGAMASASGNYDRANYNLQHVQARYNVLAKQRFDILKQLR